jgi:hypothetical protein
LQADRRLRQVDDFHAAPCAPRDVFPTRPRS